VLEEKKETIKTRRRAKKKGRKRERDNKINR
jgi:hypothetical protein